MLPTSTELIQSVLHSLESVHKRLFVDHDLRCVGSRTCHSWGYRTRVGVQYYTKIPCKASVRDHDTKGHSQLDNKPVVYRFIQTQHHHIEVLEDCSSLYLVPQEDLQCVAERGKGGVKHEFILIWIANDVEYDVRDVLVDGKMRVIEDNVAFSQYRQCIITM